jgi:glycosyltransferase involved in cell wall biosynthesis
MLKLIRVSTASISSKVLLKGQLNLLRNYFDLKCVCGDYKFISDINETEKVICEVIKMERKISIFKDLISLIRLYFFFKREKPIIVHSISPKAGLLSMTAAYFAKVPIRIHTFTGLIFPTQKGVLKKILILMDKFICYFSTDIYPEGNGVKNDLINHGITKKNLEVLVNGSVNGIDLDYFNQKNISLQQKTELISKLKLNDDDFVYVYVGRLVTDKGINEMIDAFNQLSFQYKKIKLLLVGTYEPELDPLKNITKKIIRNNINIISVGYQNDIRPFLSISDIFVFPSYREGFPNVLMQAGAMGIPSIVTNINGSNEIIIEGLNGVIIEPKDVSSLKLKMTEFYKNRQFHLKLKNNSRINILNRYDQSLVWDSLLKEYNSLIKIRYERS